MTPQAHPEPVAGEHCCRAEAASLVYVEGLIPAQVFAQDLQSPPPPSRWHQVAGISAVHLVFIPELSIVFHHHHQLFPEFKDEL